ncbi:hypothetical protein EAX61_14130 [Dokdonia sinensis]|uniref:Tetratricopeptide repeat protein n=1 Tax=Dokdonia sinensis TaxID=2479847 RepID=A0A3M0G3S1_9FLAO|nr:hypothetical protein [Dokdonia sinensis]RMB56543.1 hypothetical protein EAX61_14130 [Dokdonia sinensis]
MNTPTFTYLLEHPEHVTASQTVELRELLHDFPYFQSAHALYLKGLKNQESFAYNNALKVTAAHTADRSVLFDYITSQEFNQNNISEQIKLQEQRLRGIEIKELQDVTAQLDIEEMDKANKILDPSLFIEKVNSEMTSPSPEEMLEVGKPLSFDKQETHSFSEWLQFTSFKPIERTTTHSADANETDTPQEEEVSDSSSSSSSSSNMSTLSRKRKRDIIDTFIETNPKIKVSNDIKVDKKPFLKENFMSQESLMTETLARVYVEQKNYKKAKQAYRILSLKYPEKSGFFADQIRAVEQLEEK